MMEYDSQHFLNLIRRSHRGRFKVYIGMIAGVGKTYRMLQDAHEMLRCGTDVQIGYVETHDRPDTVKMLKGLPIIPRKKIFYKGKEIERHLMSHMELVVQLGGSIHQKASDNIAQAIADFCREQHVTLLCMGQPSLAFPLLLIRAGQYRKLLAELKTMGVELVIFA